MSLIPFRWRILTDDEFIAERLGRPRLVPPWLWHMGSELTLLVYAMVSRSRL